MGTWFIISWNVASKNTNYTAKELFSATEKMARHVPIIFKTDGFNISNGFQNSFW